MNYDYSLSQIFFAFSGHAFVSGVVNICLFSCTLVALGALEVAGEAQRRQFGAADTLAYFPQDSSSSGSGAAAWRANVGSESAGAGAAPVFIKPI